MINLLAMNSMKKIFSILTFFILFFILHASFFIEHAFAQTIKSHGIPFIKNYGPDVYEAASQNWAICQDKRGVMFFGNTEGLLEFDGTSWHLLEMTNKSAVRTFLKTDDGRIYCGAENDFGYLETDSIGHIKFHSMSSLIPEKHRLFSSVWNIFLSEKKLIIISSKKIFIIDGEDVKVLEADKLYAYQANDKIYVLKKGLGLCVIENEELKKLPSGEQFENEKIVSIVAYSKNEVLLYCKNKGFYLYDGKVFTPFKTDFDDWIKKSEIYCDFALGNDCFAYGTLFDGLFVMDKKGKCILHLNKATGLSDDEVLAMAKDETGNLWVAQGTGLSYVEINSPITRYGIEFGLDSKMVISTVYKNNLYIGGGISMYQKEWETTENPFQRKKFVKVDKTAGQSWQIQAVNDKLINVNSSGLQIINGNKTTHLEYDKSQLWAFAQLKNQKNKLFVGSNEGILLYKEAGDSYQFQFKIKGYEEPARFIALNDDRTLWISIISKGVYKLKLNEALDSVVSSKLYNSAAGLPTDVENLVTFVGDKLIAATSRNFYYYNSTTDCFEPYIAFNELIKKNKSVSIYMVEPNGNVWYNDDVEIGYFVPQKNGKYSIFNKPFNKLSEIKELYSITKINETEYAIGTNIGFIHYEARFTRDYNQPFATLLRRVEIVGSDSLIFGGTFPINCDTFSLYQPIKQINRIKYKNNSLRFVFSSTFYENNDKTCYQYMLVNFDKDWSNWSKETKKEYTNLPEGTYTFMVKAKNIYNTESSVAVYRFTILSPWYRTYWAYLFYFLFFTIVVWFIVYLNLKRLKHANEKLESTVKERTTEIMGKNIELETQKEEMQAQADSLEEAYAEIMNQKEEIHQIHNQILSSINYASIIQNAVLPTPRFIQQFFPEHFIIYRPRDIVSGDFYFIKQISDYYVIAAADCTGHGVPGAFMCMLGIALLNEIVHNIEINCASRVLDKLRIQIKNALQQTGLPDEVQEGMDIAFCIINNNTLEMSYSGAFSPLWLVKNSDSAMLKGNSIHDQFVIYEGDTQPVGVYSKEKSFTEHKIQLEKNDVFYIFTDGYVSQFGSEKNETFKTYRFKKLLKEIHLLPMDEQKQILETRFSEWKENQAQTDDVLVLGVRI